MAIKGSGSPMEAVDEYFDMLIKSRFIEISHSTDTKHVPLGSLIKPYVAQRCEDCDYPVLSITRHQGLILQSDRFKKEIASRDKSQYKVIPRNVLVVAFPIDEGLLCAQQIVDNGLVSPAYKTYKIDEKIVFPRILELILRSDKSISYYLSKMRGTTLRRRTLPEEEFQSMLIDLPSMSMQKHFIKMLEQIDVVKIICKQIFQLFDDLVKSRFIEMFGNQDINDRGFQASTIGESCIIRDSERIPITSTDREPGPYPYYGANGIQDYVKDYIFDGEFVLMAEDGGYFDDISRPNCYYVSGKCWVNNHAHILQPRESLNIHYLDWSIKYRDLTALVNGTTRAKLTQSAMRTIPIFIPPIHLQNEFASFLKQVDKSKFEVVQSLLRLKSKYIRTETPSKRTDCDL